MIAGQIPNDPNGPKVIRLAQIQDLFDELGCRCIFRILGNRLLVDQPRFTILFVKHLPAVIASSAPTPKYRQAFLLHYQPLPHI